VLAQCGFSEASCVLAQRCASKGHYIRMAPLKHRMVHII